ncbi:unnamed protein product [Meganyctiphanes norvegica]|uniref:Uncharacterized protein n=1 Tax=Meganyctiphanes norvegica TaxID=48144 RepID=A0AAV2RKC6_MEGNR
MNLHATIFIVFSIVLLTATVPTVADDDLGLTQEQLSIESLVIDLLTPFLGEYGPLARDVINMAREGLGLIGFIKTVGNQIFNGTSIEINFGTDKKILTIFEFLSKKIDQVEHGVIGVEESLRHLSQSLPSLLRWEIALESLGEYIGILDTYYKRFIFYQKEKDKIESHTLQDFAESVVGHNMDSVMTLMALIHNKAVPNGKPLRAAPSQHTIENGSPYSGALLSSPQERNYRQLMLMTEKTGKQGRMERFSIQSSIFKMLNDVLENYDNCLLSQSPQQLIYGLYLKVALAEARGYSMISFSYMLLRAKGHGNFSAEQIYSEEMYRQYTADILHEAKKVMSAASTRYRRCDPPKHTEGETFVQLNELLQGIIENEVDMNKDGTCRKNCAHYDYVQSEGCFSSDTQYCGNDRRCSGTLHECQFFDADAYVCKSNDPYRRYDWIEYENKVHFGPGGKCNGEKVKVDSWWRWFVHCSYCICLCDDGDSKTTDRFISLMPALSDTNRNMVITGIRIIKRNQVIHLQIQQGQALPQGQVNTTTLEWQQVEQINVHSSSHQDGLHFKKLSFEYRTMDLDTLTGLNNHVVTGIRFRSLEKRMHIEIQVNPINFTTGEIEAFNGVWVNNGNDMENITAGRGEITVADSDIPTRYNGATQITAEDNSYIEFGQSSLHKDISQSTVPFFDAQKVSPIQPAWLSGVGIYHKSREGTGGFLGLQVLTYNISEHL